MNELISVIVPVYNIAPHLRRSIQSILNQTHQNLEIVAVDDGSTDDSYAVLLELAVADQRVRVVHQENGGVTSARLRGVREACGEWIGFVDGDDYIEPEMYQRLLDNAINHHAQLSHCGYQMVFPSRTDYYYNTGRLVQQDSREALKELLGGSFEPGLCNKLFHKSLFHSVLKNGIIDLSIRINEDLLMNYYLFREANQTVFEDFCPYHYMVRKGSAATSELKPYKLRDPGTVRRILMDETKMDAELYSLCFSSYIAYLKRVATMDLRNRSEEITACIQDARKELRFHLPEIRNANSISKKEKYLSIWAALWPESYHVIHHLYGEFTGTNHKYDIN